LDPKNWNGFKKHKTQNIHKHSESNFAVGGREATTTPESMPSTEDVTKGFAQKDSGKIHPKIFGFFIFPQNILGAQKNLEIYPKHFGFYFFVCLICPK
jgi:hypothetical protein